MNYFIIFKLTISHSIMYVSNLLASVKPVLELSDWARGTRLNQLLSFKSVGIGYGRAKGNSRVYDSLFRNQLGKSADRNNPAD
jgi:hypothetical protein